MRSVRTALAVALALGIAAAVAAQEKPKSKGPATKLSPVSQAMLRMERLRTVLEELDLTAEQKEKLEKIREEHGPKMKELLDKIRDILTEDQRKAAEEAVQKAKEDGKKGRSFFEAVEASIKLTDEQNEKLGPVGREIGAVVREMMKEAMGVLTPEQREKVKEKLAPPKKAVQPAEKQPAK